MRVSGNVLYIPRLVDLWRYCQYMCIQCAGLYRLVPDQGRDDPWYIVLYLRAKHAKSNCSWYSVCNNKCDVWYLMLPSKICQTSVTPVKYNSKNSR